MNAWKRPSKAVIVLILISASALGEYLMQDRSITIIAKEDNFPTLLSSWDTNLFLWINVNMSNFYTGQLFSLLTLLGSFSASFILCGYLFLSGENRKSALAFTSVILATVLTAGMKSIVDRPRPFMVLEDVHLLSLEMDPSFPSGHASRVFSLLHLTHDQSRRLRLLGRILACLVAISRVYLGVHYPLDVLGGALFGLVASGVARHHERQIIAGFGSAATLLGLVPAPRLNTRLQ